MTQIAEKPADYVELTAILAEHSARIDSLLAGMTEITGKLASIDDRFTQLETVIAEVRPLLESPLVTGWRKRLLAGKARRYEGPVPGGPAA